MPRDRAHFLLLNVGHFLDHLFTLVFATVAALALTREWGMRYAELLAFATPGFFAFGVFALPAGWIADRWSREAMMVIFFVGTGAAAILTALAQTPLQVGLGLFAIGVFAAIYHPVGLAILTLKWANTGMRIAANGVWGNFGVASAALITGWFIDHGGWRLAFIAPGVLSIALGAAYGWLQRAEIAAELAAGPARRQAAKAARAASGGRLPRGFLRVSVIVFVTTALASAIYQATTFALPKMFDERLSGLAATLGGRLAGGEVATVIGALAFVVFAVASVAQLIVGAALDRLGPRAVFLAMGGLMAVCFALMPGLSGGAALAVAFGFMSAPSGRSRSTTT